MQVFLALMRHRKSTAAAEEIGLTQPAVSHALKRLRTIYGDKLFLRKPQGLEPTYLARELEGQLREVMALLEGSLQIATRFDPAEVRATVRIAASDYELAAIIPPLIARLAHLPGLRIEAVPSTGDSAMVPLERGEVDLVLRYADMPKARLPSDPIHEDIYVVAARSAHPIFRGALDTERYASARHLLVTPDGRRRGLIDAQLAQAGYARDAAASVPLFFSALAVLQETDLIATLPARIVERYGTAYGLSARDLPFPSPRFGFAATRHPRDIGNPLHDWLLGQLRSVTERH